MRKHRPFRFTLYIALLVIFCLSVYKVVNGYTNAKREQDAFEKLSSLVDENTLPSSRQALQEESFSANQTDGLISASDTPLSPDSQNDEPNVAISPTEQPVKPISTIEDFSQITEVEESLAAPVILPQYAPLYKMNPDFFGWLTIEGMVIDYPVMHTPDDPEHYMHRAFDGSYSYSGVLFLDGNCSTNGNYYLIYGHHMRNGTMFGRLPDYQDEEFCKEHSVICFDTLYEQRKYMVLAAFFSQIYDNGEKGVFRYYEYFDLSDQADFDDYVRQVHAAAIYDTGIEVEYGDELLVLSTCNYHTSNGRFVVVAKRIQ